MTPLSELVRLRDDLNAQIAEAQAKARDEGKAKARALLAEYGMNVNDLLPARVGRRSAAKASMLPIKYRRGADTWTGRGLQPVWLREAIAAGAELEHFRVDGS